MMRLDNPCNALSEAVGAAIYRDLPDIEYTNRDWDAWRKMTKEEQTESIKNKTEPMVSTTRRPYYDDVEVIMFPQTWGSTALGYGGMGGAAMTSAYTIVVSYRRIHYCVYFGSGRLAYSLLNYNDASDEGRQKFFDDLSEHNLEDIRGSGKYR